MTWRSLICQIRLMIFFSFFSFSLRLDFSIDLFCRIIEQVIFWVSKLDPWSMIFFKILSILNRRRRRRRRKTRKILNRIKVRKTVWTIIFWRVVNFLLLYFERAKIFDWFDVKSKGEKKKRKDVREKREKETEKRHKTTANNRIYNYISCSHWDRCSLDTQ